MNNSFNTMNLRVVPKGSPTIIRNCPKCKHQTQFHCSYKFRVNANGKSIDIWLIYRCEKCESTWNMEILSRVNPATIDKEVYKKYLSNDRELIQNIIFDMTFYTKNRAVVDYSALGYTIEGNIMPIKRPVEIKILSPFPLMVRMDKFLSDLLELSRSAIKKSYENNEILSMEPGNLLKIKLKDGISVILK